MPQDDLAKVASVLSGGGAEASALAQGSAAEVVGGGAGGVTVSSLLLEARAHGRAVGAFNVYNLEGALAVRKAVEATGLPAILQLHPASMDFGGTALIAACLEVAAGCKTAPILCRAPCRVTNASSH